MTQPQPKRADYESYAAHQEAVKVWRAANPRAWECVALTVWMCNPSEPHFHYKCGYTEGQTVAGSAARALCVGDPDCTHPLSEHDKNGCAHKLPREDWFDNDDTTTDDIYCSCTTPNGKGAS